MFSRIRYAARVLSYSPPKPDRSEVPDIIFEEEQPRAEVGRISSFIGTSIEILVVSTIIGMLSAPMVTRFLSHEHANVLTAVGFLASLLAFGAHRLIEDLNKHIRLQLRIGERIAPYFGHKISRTFQMLRG
jgi:hypothetical protein